MKLINNESRNDCVLKDGENNQSTRSYPDFCQYAEPRQSHAFLRIFDVRLLWLHYYNRGAIKSLRWHNRHPFIISQDIQSSSQISLLAEQPLQSPISGCDIITTEPWAVLQVIFILLKINCSLQNKQRLPQQHSHSFPLHTQESVAHFNLLEYLRPLLLSLIKTGWLVANNSWSRPNGKTPRAPLCCNYLCHVLNKHDNFCAEE